MKIKRVGLCLVILLLAIWVAAVINANILTAVHGSEFRDLETIGFDGMHPWGSDPSLRVLSYSKNKATAYYYGKMGGEKALFSKMNGQWSYERNTLAWSNYGGTADNYFVWPYYKNWVI